MQDPRPAFFAKPLPAAVNPTVETELRQAGKLRFCQEGG